MKMTKKSNFDKVFESAPKRAVRKRDGVLMQIKPNYKEICERELHEELKNEKRCTSLVETALGCVWMDLIVMEDYPNYYEPGLLERSLSFYSNMVDSLFLSMHRIAYFEGLLNTDNPEFDTELFFTE